MNNVYIFNTSHLLLLPNYVYCKWLKFQKPYRQSISHNNRGDISSTTFYYSSTPYNFLLGCHCRYLQGTYLSIEKIPLMLHKKTSPVSAQTLWVKRTVQVHWSHKWALPSNQSNFLLFQGSTVTGVLAFLLHSGKNSSTLWLQAWES